MNFSGPMVHAIQHGKTMGISIHIQCNAFSSSVTGKKKEFSPILASNAEKGQACLT